MSIAIYDWKNSQNEFFSFKKIVIIVSLIHLIIVGLFLFGSFKKKSVKKVTLLQLLPQGSLVKGTPNSSLEASRDLSEMASPPTEKVFSKNKPTPSSPPTPVSQPAKPTPSLKKTTQTKISTPKINLTEVKRTTQEKVILKPVSRSAPSANSSPASKSTPSSPGLDPNTIKGRLQSRVGKAGVMSATADGQSGAWNGSNSSEASTYFTLIRDVYYQAWQQPTPDLSQKWAAILKIRVNKQGQVLKATLEQNSGYAPLDASVKQVSLVVKSIGAPLPDVLGTQFADISIVFEF